MRARALACVQPTCCGDDACACDVARPHTTPSAGELFPGLPGRVSHAEVSTPLSTEHFARWPAGAAYGLDATPARFMAAGGLGFGPRTPLPGLLLAGQVRAAQPWERASLPCPCLHASARCSLAARARMRC